MMMMVKGLSPVGSPGLRCGLFCSPHRRVQLERHPFPHVVQPASPSSETIVRERRPHNDRRAVIFTAAGAIWLLWRADKDRTVMGADGALAVCVCVFVPVSLHVSASLHWTTSLVGGCFYLLLLTNSNRPAIRHWLHMHGVYVSLADSASICSVAVKSKLPSRHWELCLLD